MSSLVARAGLVLRALATRARRDEPAAIRRILVAHYLLLGDTVLLAPLLKRLAATWPDAERVVLVRPAFVPLFAGRPYGARALAFDRRDDASLGAVVASGPYDLAIVPDDNRYAWLAKAAGARRVVAFADDRPAWKNAMVDVAVPYPDRPTAWADAAAMRLVDGVRFESPAPFTRGEWPAPAAAEFERPAGDYVVLHVGASTPLKAWGAARWRTVADRLGERFTIVWSAGAAERAIVDAIGVRPGEHDCAGRLDLAQLWALLAGARALVCPDTGVAHLARLVGVPTVALFGPASSVVHGPGAFWAEAPFVVVTDDGVPCRDQRVLFRRTVPWVRRCGRRFDATAAPAGASDPDACGRPLCMEAVSIAAVSDALERLLARSAR